MKPITEPTVAPTIIPTLVATGRIMGQTMITPKHINKELTRQTLIYSNNSPNSTCMVINNIIGVAVWFVQVTISRLMKQLSDPAELLAAHTYFPDMLLLRLLSLRVPVFSSKTAWNTEDLRSSMHAYTLFHVYMLAHGHTCTHMTTQNSDSDLYS